MGLDCVHVLLGSEHAVGVHPECVTLSLCRTRWLHHGDGIVIIPTCLLIDCRYFAPLGSIFPISDITAVIPQHDVSAS